LPLVKTLTLGTKNRDKVREIRDILLRVPLELVPLPDSIPVAPEDAPTLEGNARLKAAHYAKLAGTWCIADDTGLVVDALAGAPGVYSARYAGPDASYADNRRKLLEALGGVRSTRRTARFVCVAALANPAGEILGTTEGVLEGTIIDHERGEGGFGYDPIFLPLEGELTLAEISHEDKNASSHRARALEAMRPLLLELL